jgi:hypothetical protein
MLPPLPGVLLNRLQAFSLLNKRDSMLGYNVAPNWNQESEAGFWEALTGTLFSNFLRKNY